MSSCLSQGTGRAYGFDLENIVKCSSTTSSITSHSSSPSSTLSESSNSLITISTRKPRTPRKRPNQTYNEAAALLSTACPTIFSTKNLKNKNHNLSNFTKQHSNFFQEPPELLLPVRLIENSGFLLINQPIMENPNSLIESKVTNSCRSPGEIESIDRNWNSNSNYQDDFDTESMLDEEIGEGIDSIMGNSKSKSKVEDDEFSGDKTYLNSKTCYGYPIGLGFGGNMEFGMRNGMRALRNVDEGNWWSFPMVNVVNISPAVAAPAKSDKVPVGKKNKKKKEVEEFMKRLESESGDLNPENGARLLLKLNYDDVLNAWSDKGSPLPEGPESPGSDIHARLAQIDLFSENDGVREVKVIHKKHTRPFSKKIKYQLRKPNADRRPRSKGRFVRGPNSSSSEET